MRDDDAIRPQWRFFDGAVSISLSMLLTVMLSECRVCGGTPLLGYLKTLTGRDDGMKITATLLLFPTSLALHGGMVMIFAAKAFVDRKVAEWDQRQRERAHAEGLAEGRRAERQRIQRELEAHGVPLTPEPARILADETD